MIAGLLLLYIGMKLGLPFLYFVGCWVLIGLNLIKFVGDFLKGVYNAGAENGKQGTDKSV